MVDGIEFNWKLKERYTMTDHGRLVQTTLDCRRVVVAWEIRN